MADTLIAPEGQESRVYIGLGSNLSEGRISPVKQILNALEELAALDSCRLIAASSLYRSAPMGPQDQPEYVNAVARLQTALSPDSLLDVLQQIELTHGRDRTSGIRWGARTLDLDILAWGEQSLDLPHLVVPHPGIAEREFVLIPWSELDPRFTIPGLGLVADLAERVPRRGLSVIEAVETDQQTSVRS